jgi:23S rRNA-/tRNA-specific pseudouridylate synthase
MIEITTLQAIRSGLIDLHAERVTVTFANREVYRVYEMIEAHPDHYEMLIGSIDHPVGKHQPMRSQVVDRWLANEWLEDRLRVRG